MSFRRRRGRRPNAGLIKAGSWCSPNHLQVYCTQQWQDICWRHWEEPCVCSGRHNGRRDCWGNWKWPTAIQGKLLDKLICCHVALTRLLQGPCSLVTDSKGSLLVVDSHNHRIQLLNPDYTFKAMVKVIIWNMEHFLRDNWVNCWITLPTFRLTTLWLAQPVPSWILTVGKFGWDILLNSYFLLETISLLIMATLTQVANYLSNSVVMYSLFWEVERRLFRIYSFLVRPALCFVLIQNHLIYCDDNE